MLNSHISHYEEKYMSPRKIPQLPRKTVYIDEKGRVVIPKYLRKAIGVGEDGGYIDVEAYPSLENCKTLIIKKASGS